jgi:hypothetical protein
MHAATTHEIHIFLIALLLIELPAKAAGAATIRKHGGPG